MQVEAGFPGGETQRAGTRPALKGAYPYLTDTDLAGLMEDIPLPYCDPEHYEFEILAADSSKVYFKGRLYFRDM